MKAATGFEAVIRVVMRRLSCSRSDAKELLEAIGIEVARQTLLRKQRVVWPRLGAFRVHEAKSMRLSMEAFKRDGRVPEGVPDFVQLPPMRKLRFRPSKKHALLVLSEGA
jgi:hypothetical protein